MTLTIFPAQPGTLMLVRDPGVTTIQRVPVIGWQHMQGNLAYPICVMNHGGLTHGKAILHPEGFVTDAIHGLTFESEAEWVNFIKSAKPKSAQKPVERDSDDRAAKMPDEDADDAPDAPETDDEDVHNGEDDANDRAAADHGSITFGTKTYKTNSFWVLADREGHDIGVFQIEGDTPYPKDDRCRKVTRDEFAAAKREGVPVIDPHSGEIPEDDDDDAMDLV